jgi:hypothetical protein
MATLPHLSPPPLLLPQYNFFGPNELEPVDLTAAAWLECIDELERRRCSAPVCMCGSLCLCSHQPQLLELLHVRPAALQGEV